MVMTEITKVLTFFRGLDARDLDLAARHINPVRFVQHVASATEGFDKLMEQISRYFNKDHRLRVIRNFQDGPYVVTQAEGSVFGQNVFFDVFRFEEGAIVERWAFSDKAAPPNPSGHTQNDGPVEAKADQDTEKNKSLVRGYYEVVHIEGQHDRIPIYIWESCIRHEPGVRDGMAAFIRDVEAATRRGKLSRSIDKIELLLGQGDFVFITASGSIEGEPCTFVDLYRVSDGTIVEHWGFPEKL
jgi:predicted SnoaL-like aldol condensation-catalyzing enzyme